MRLLQSDDDSNLSLTEFLESAIPNYAILSHKWGANEVTFKDLTDGTSKSKASGYSKIQFCRKQARRDGLQYFWIDTCCIDKSSSAELSEAINSMFRWYQEAARCYVYLSDVSTEDRKASDVSAKCTWESAFRASKWFTRGWTLQELLAPISVEFYSQEGKSLGNKTTLGQQIHEITGIPISALQGSELSQFSSNQIFGWAKNRQTTREEDWVYSLLGIFGISMPIIYGEGRKNAVRRLTKEMDVMSECSWDLYVTDPRVDTNHIETFPPLTGITSIRPSQPPIALLEDEQDLQDQASSRHLFASISSLVQQTQHTFLSEDSMSQRNLAHVYRRLAQHGRLLRQLASEVEEYTKCQDERPIACPNCSKQVSKECGNLRARTDNSDQLSSISANMFFDCASRFSCDESPASISKLSASFTGSPTYILERKTSFYPELYAIAGFFRNPLFVVAMKQSCNQNQLTHQYYLLYAQTPRFWRQVVVSATFKTSQELSTIPQVSTPDNDDYVCKILPDAVNTILNTFLPRTELFPSVTRISFQLNDDEASRNIQRLPQIESAEDRLEIEMSKEDEILRNIEIMGCHIFPESKIEVTSRISSSCFIVKLDGQACTERKRPFASAGWDGENSLRGFIKDLKLHNSLQGCHGISRLIGVVFDDAHLRLKSYLYEAPMISQLIRVFYIANSRSEIIPWSIRELWSKQIAQAMAEVHSKGLVIGVLVRNNIGLRTDGSAILVNFTTSPKNWYHEKSLMPPEVQSPHGNAPQKPFNDRTDIFQLALLLWLLAEHKANITGVRCSRYICTNIPRYQCTADHANPVHLPPCLSGIPSYFSNIITQCRSLNPEARPTARKIAEILSSQCNLKVCPRDVLKLLKTYTDDVTFGVHCSECGERALQLHYHCYVCEFGNFDLCPDCVAQGIHCFVLEHKLVGRRGKNGGFVHVS